MFADPHVSFFDQLVLRGRCPERPEAICVVNSKGEHPRSHNTQYGMFNSLIMISQAKWITARSQHLPIGCGDLAGLSWRDEVCRALAHVPTSVIYCDSLTPTLATTLTYSQD